MEVFPGENHTQLSLNLKSVEVAKEKGNREAGRLFNVGESSVREWREAETVLKSLHKRKHAMQFRRCLWPTIEYNKTGQMKRPSYKDIVAWIVESWDAVNENCVRNGFIKARGDEAVSGDSDYVHDETFSEMEAEEIP